MRRLIALATVVATALLAPAALGAGATHFSESWTNEPSEWFMGEFGCTGQPATVAGTGLESGSVKVVNTTNGGEHVRLDVQGYVDLYAASGNPADGITLGAYVGRWTYSANGIEERNAGGTEVFTGVTHGPIVLADGSRAVLKVSFVFLIHDGDVRSFFAKGTCAGE